MEIKSSVKQNKIRQIALSISVSLLAHKSENQRLAIPNKQAILIGDLVLVVLYHVIGLATPVEAAILQNFMHVVGRLPFTRLGCKASSQLFDRVAAETGKSCIQHEGDQRNDGFTVGPTMKGFY